MRAQPFATIDETAALAGRVDGERRALDMVKSIRSGAGGPEAALRGLLGVLSASGHTVPACARLRTFARTIQAAIAEAPPST